MMIDKLTVSPSPHIKEEISTSRIMRDVIYALIPSLGVSALFFGWTPLLITLISVVSCVGFEWLIQKFFLKEGFGTKDYSAALTGILLAFNLPASIPWWIVIIGAFVSIVIAKMTFGGLGKNPFNPALVGRVFLLISYPIEMTTFPRLSSMADAFSGATPLTAIKAGMPLSDIKLQDMFFGSIPGSLGEISTLFLILGGLYLLWRKVITLHIPLSVLGSMWIFALLHAVHQGDSLETAHLFATFQILAGGAMLGAIFMATDYTTSPMTHRGMILYGAGIGVITMIIRFWGAYPEGISFAILIMNAATPLINKYLKPRRFGAKRPF